MEHNLKGKLWVKIYSRFEVGVSGCVIVVKFDTKFGLYLSQNFVRCAVVPVLLDYEGRGQNDGETENDVDEEA